MLEIPRRKTGQGFKPEWWVPLWHAFPSNDPNPFLESSHDASETAPSVSRLLSGTHYFSFVNYLLVFGTAVLSSCTCHSSCPRLYTYFDTAHLSFTLDRSFRSGIPHQEDITTGKHIKSSPPPALTSNPLLSHACSILKISTITSCIIFISVINHWSSSL